MLFFACLSHFFDLILFEFSVVKVEEEYHIQHSGYYPGDEEALHQHVVGGAVRIDVSHPYHTENEDREDRIERAEYRVSERLNGVADQAVDRGYNVWDKNVEHSYLTEAHRRFGIDEEREERS